MKEMKGARIVVGTCGVIKSGEKILIATDKNKSQITDFISEVI